LPNLDLQVQRRSLLYRQISICKCKVKGDRGCNSKFEFANPNPNPGFKCKSKFGFAKANATAIVVVIPNLNLQMQRRSWLYRQIWICKGNGDRGCTAKFGFANPNPNPGFNGNRGFVVIPPFWGFFLFFFLNL